MKIDSTAISAVRPLSMLGAARAPAILVMSLSLASMACSFSTDTKSPELVETPASASPSPPDVALPVEDATDPKAQACEAQTSRLKAGLEAARDPAADAVLAVKTETCGLRVLTGGPSKLDGTELHRIGSVTKTYVAATVLDLARSGTLSLSDPVGKWVSDVPDGGAITIRQLLNHTSGLFNYTDDRAFMRSALKGERAWTPRELLEVAFAHEPYFAPGASFHYSNTGYILLGLVVEAASKSTIGALVRARVLRPLGATATFFDGEEPIGGTLAAGLDASGNDARTIGPSWAWSAGAIVASPKDVVRWIEALGGGTFFDASTQRELLSTVATDEPTARYGLGLMVLDARVTGGAGPGYGHGGDTPGYHTQAFHFPDSKTTIVAIVDSEEGSVNDISASALGVLFAAR